MAAILVVGMVEPCHPHKCLVHQFGCFDAPARLSPQVVCGDFLEFGIDQRNGGVKGVTIARVDPLKKLRKFHENDHKDSRFENDAALALSWPPFAHHPWADVGPGLRILLSDQK